MATFLENRTFDEIRVGQTAELQRTLTRDDVALFSKVSGDLNPIHMDEAYARAHGAQGVVGHSLWATGLISSLLANVLPGPGTVYRNQDAVFHRQVALGDSLTARVWVVEKEPQNLVLLRCEVVNQRGEPVMTGRAVVVAPTEKLRIEAAAAAKVTVRHHDSFNALFDKVAPLPPIPTAVVHPVDQVSLAGAMEAAESTFVEPILIGPACRIRAVAEQAGIDLAGTEIIDVEHSHAAAERAVALVREGRAEILMKGSLHTDEVLGAVLHKASGIRTERRISHIFVMDVPTYPRLLLVSDAAVNIDPDLDAKRDICQNAIDLAHTLGIAQPRVAVLSAVETIRPRIQSTLDAAALCKMADRGQIVGGILDGPLALDNAINLEAARIKKISSEVAGVADVLIAPDLEAGNILAKQLIFLANAEAAGIVLGARVPIVLTSRADSVRTRRASAATAVLHAHALRQGAPVADMAIEAAPETA
ncbi:bifunctional enoyl-CoA hydratase/phosphate acetyltransferase [Thiohalocapsa marina]|uniref:Bifunctional enoyl-CoA hydratase/phosphate acetyltransferase n=1 Tax=Thiohalocapsa marina TaxID=424902 RepID=A0A5M8FNF9_9GAMM|nr:bifunctional enoyl-CoA hydratase/phosphate acetyltransferase [Thiohalocapsa marina]KAA6185186.1 bifunctional enoyl-CoA hydratase/phosphate acetyltransferase [Thiohalocapsa marina]